MINKDIWKKKYKVRYIKNIKLSSIRYLNIIDGEGSIDNKYVRKIYFIRGIYYI